METEQTFIVAATVVFLTMIGAFYNGSMSGDKMRQEKYKIDATRYEQCINAGGSWIPVDDGMCLLNKEIKK